MAFVLLQQGQLGKAIPLGELSAQLADEGRSDRQQYHPSF